MTFDDGYECFRLLAGELQRCGLSSAAQELLGAIANGATSSECLGAAGRVLTELRRPDASSEGARLTSLIASCVKQVQLAWPSYR
jgi:hypothetical protein